MVIDRILGLLALFILAAIAGAIAWPGAPRRRAHPGRISRGWRCSRACSCLLAIFTQAFSRLFPSFQAVGSKFGLIVSELREMSTTYRGRLDVVFGLPGTVGLHPRTERPGFLSGRQDALSLPRDDDDPGTALLDGAA